MRTYGLRFDVNCSILFTELPVLARPAAARAAGFDAVEFWWPFEEMVPADAASAIDASVLVEAINSVDAPAFPVDSSEAAITGPGLPRAKGRAGAWTEEGASEARE